MPIPERQNPTFAPERSPLADKIEAARQRLIVALDVPSAAASDELVRKLEGTCQWFKVGLELFTAAGPAVVEPLVSRGHSVFLDLKFHDIPNTVAGAVRSASAWGVRMMNVHAAGGPAMLAAAKAALDGVTNPPELLAVTVLTSMDAAALKAAGVDRSPAQQVDLLAKMCIAAGIRGFVCSSEEVAALRALTGPDGVLGHSRNSSRRLRNERPEAHGHAGVCAERRSKLPGGRPSHHASCQSRCSSTGGAEGDG